MSMQNHSDQEEQEVFERKTWANANDRAGAKPDDAAIPEDRANTHRSSTRTGKAPLHQ